jgi:DNA-binding transcriptional ArsR family regulator
MQEKIHNLKEKVETGQKIEFQLLKMLADPMRTRIILELLLHDELDTKELQKRIPISRSTLGHHLQKLVEFEIIKVRINEKGYATKFYSLTQSLISKFSLKQLIDTPDEKFQSQMIINSFASLVGVMQFISNIATESYNQLTNVKIENVIKKENAILYTTKGKEIVFPPISFNIIPNHLVPQYQEYLREFIEKTKKIIIDSGPVTNSDLPLYAFINTGFPLLFQDSI